MESLVRRLSGIATVVMITVCSSNASYAGDRDHDGGFFLRLSAGVGGASTSIDDGNDELTMSGPSGDLNFAIGAMVSRNLALHGTLFGWAITDPDVEFNNVKGEANGDLSLSGIGAGLTYFIMPANVYLSGTIGVGEMSFDAGNLSVESDLGPMVDLTIGKEWWVGRNWGIGVAAALGLHSIPDKDADENLSGASFAIRFSATMN